MLRLNRRLLAKLIRLSRQEWAELLRAQVAVLHAQLLAWTRPRGWLMTRSVSSGAPASGGAEVEPAAKRLALAVGRVAEHGLWRPSCLVRAVALHRALQSRGLAGSSVCVGVRLDHGRFLAHAWVDYRGSVLADEAWHVKKFDDLAQMVASQAS